MGKTELSEKIKEADLYFGKEYLTLKQLARFLNKSEAATRRLIFKYWEKWSIACLESNVKCGPNDTTLLVPNFGKSKEECFEEIKRVAQIINTKTLGQEDFKNLSKIHPQTIIRKFGSWETPLKILGLEPGKNFHRTIGIEELANDFLEVTNSLGKIPSSLELAHRGKFSKGLYETKFKKYSSFKSIVSKHILTEQLCKDSSLIKLFENEAKKLKPESNNVKERPHYEGKTLNFRHFAYNPTYENEVVSIFSAVAGELGFEIITIRDAFPDCKARRKSQNFRDRMKDCLIEFEFRSSDFVKHKHPINGCDLIICWEHDWIDCPIEVINLKKEINKLPGWK